MIGGLLQNERSDMEQVPVARQPAGARPAVLEPVLSEEGDRSRDHRHAASRQAGTARHVVATPLDNTVPANDADFFLTGNTELSRSDHRALIGHGMPFSGTFSICRREATNVVAVRN